MALTAAQRNAIWTYLGYEAEPSVTYGIVAQINAKLDLISTDPVLQAPIDAILAELVTVDGAVAAAGATTTTTGALKKVDEVEFHPPTVLTTALATVVNAIKRGRMLIRRLAQRIGSPLGGPFRYLFIVGDYFDLLDPRPPVVLGVSSEPRRGW